MYLITTVLLLRPWRSGMERMILTSQASGQLNLRGRGMREIPPDVFADLSGADGAREDKAGGLLRTTTRTHNGARLTFRLDAHRRADSVRGGVHQTVV